MSNNTDVWEKIRMECQAQTAFCETHEDTVKTLVMRQRNTQTAIRNGTPFNAVNQPTVLAEHFRNNILAAHAELSEALDWVSWKPWKAVEPLSANAKQNAKLELVDTLCFLLNAWNLLGGNPEELSGMHRAKCEENIRRQKGL